MVYHTWRQHKVIKDEMEIQKTNLEQHYAICLKIYEQILIQDEKVIEIESISSRQHY